MGAVGAKASQALLTLVNSENPSARLFLGEDSLGLVEQKMEAMREEIAAWEAVSRGTGCFGVGPALKD